MARSLNPTKLTAPRRRVLTVQLQTGTGKTYTMFGDPRGGSLGDGGRQPVSASPEESAGCECCVVQSMGLIPRCAFAIFEELEKRQYTAEWFVTASFFQMYMEAITDLLEPDKGNLQIRVHALSATL